MNTYAILLSLLLISGHSMAAESSDFIYYKNLWLENVKKASQWKQPTGNSEFKNVPLNNCIQNPQSYDFVIVGGGTAGSVLANRLSANPKWNVLVIEAGGNETDFSLTPGAYLTATLSDMNWGYLTKPQPHSCLSLPDGRCAMPRGKVLGGETALKDVVYARGNLNDFDKWGKFWSQQALKYLKVLENATALNSDQSDEKYRGTRGFFHIEYPKVKGPLTDEIFNSFRELGVDTIHDYNGQSQFGVSNVQAYTKRGRRGSTNQNYLQPVLDRPNLKVLTHAFATKIVFNQTTRRQFDARQLEYIHDGTCNVVNITKELLLTGGPINTPQLLMLSGIGPRDELTRHNITTVYDLPAVGQNLFDHIAVRLDIGINKTYTYRKFDDELNAYLNSGSGSLAEPLARQVAFVNTEHRARRRRGRASVPNFEMMFVELNPQLLYPPPAAANLSVPAVRRDFSIQVLHLHPQSKGSITLGSNDPTDYPIIDPLYLESRRDQRAWLEILNFIIRKLMRTNSFQAMNATLGADFAPDACKNQTGDDELICIIKHKSLPMHHQCGTCRMGRSARRSCVSRELLLHGSRNLRVVDSSVIPETTSGHTIPYVIMIAEAISDYLLELY